MTDSKNNIPANEGKSFSLEGNPAKIGKEKDEEFSFSDVPVLGAENKKSPELSFESLFNAQGKKDQKEESKDPSVSLLEQLLSSDKTDSSDGEEALSKTKVVDLSNTDTHLPVPPASKSEKWKKIFSAGTNKSRKLVVISCALLLFLVISVGGVLTFLSFFSRGRAQNPGEEGKGPAAVSPSDKNKSPEELAAERQKKIEEALASADSYLKESKYEEAITVLRSLTDMVSGSEKANVLSKLGQSMEGLGKMDEAISNYTLAIETPGAPADLKALSKLCAIMNMKGDYQQVAELIQKYSAKFSGDPNVNLQAAVCFSHLGRNAEALEQFKKIHRQELNLEQLKIFARLLKKSNRSQASDLYLYGGKKFVSIECFHQAAELQGKLSEKINIIKEAEQLFSKDPEKQNSIKIVLAELYEKAGKKDEALLNAETTDINAIPAESCLKLFKILLLSGDKEKLTKSATEILMKFSGKNELIKKFQDIMMAPEYDELRIDVFSNWMNLDRKNPEAIYFYGRALSSSPSAKSYYEEAVSLSPDFGDAWLEAGLANYRQRNWRDAELAFEKASKLMPSNKEAGTMLA